LQKSALAFYLENDGGRPQHPLLLHPSGGTSGFRVIHAIFPSRRGLLPSVRTLIDFLGEEFSRSDIAWALVPL